ncbi:hypothetical protein [Thiohalomonas denitrificans]|uniref:hypothetical protein n=1 Tax=Thiohalomonas denitrificans TaxID=415747 RepID=UPI0026EE21F4|nr:hypothetical protein [Thiohalomonas denitrificans]
MRRLLIVLMLVALPAYTAALTPLIEVDVTVVGENGRPLEGVSVRGDFVGVVPGDGHVERQVTDEKGFAKLLGRSFFPVRVTAGKLGYYETLVEINTKEVGEKEYSDQEITLTLREKRNPIPLYAIKYSGEIPVAEEWVGFDLQKADWVSPYGDGVVPDFLFWYEGSVESFLNAEGVLKVRFSSPDDGLREIEPLTTYSRLLVPHEAPKSGYVGGEKIFIFKVTGEPPILKGGSAYYFARIRSERDSKGDLIESHYAKIYEGISFDPRMKDGESGVAWVGFTYYFNPVSNDRNLEFDTSRNLFNELSFDQRVKNP